MKLADRTQKVAIVYRCLPHYRLKFYLLLRKILERNGIELVLIYGQPGKADAKKKDTVDISWAIRIRNRIFSIMSKEIYWQPCLKYLKDVDLVIVEQANKLLINYLFMLEWSMGKRHFAYWGHGKNFQAKRHDRISELLKRFIAKRTSWWFAYNKTSAAIVESTGFPRDRITCVQNAIDTHELARERASLSDWQLNDIRKSLGIESANIRIFIGGMYKEKRIMFLLDACMYVRSVVPDFEVLFVGSGPDEEIVREASKKAPWIHYVGSKFGKEKIRYLAISKVMLMPGLVGLAILDSFAARVPMITTKVPYHSPEIEYLVNDYNDVFMERADSATDYSQAIVRVLENDEYHQRLVDGCEASSRNYSIEQMADNFARGVICALGAKQGIRIVDTENVR